MRSGIPNMKTTSGQRLTQSSVTVFRSLVTFLAIFTFLLTACGGGSGSSSGSTPSSSSTSSGSSSGSADTTRPTVTITTPTSGTAYTATSNTLSLSGTASDNVGVTQVTWSNTTTGASGTASGTTAWSVGGIALQSGTNVITVTARDAAGNTNTDSISVSYSPSGGDTTAPTTPTGLSATTVSSSQINLSWSASTDNIGVTGYNIYRNGTQIASVANTSYNNTGLTAATTYSYTVAAYDAAGNTSVQSVSTSTTTQGITTTSGAIYVSLSGSDTSGDGSLGNPYANISKALTVLTSGGTIIVRNGTYTDRPGMLVNDYYSATIPSGSASAFTTIKAETPYGVRLKWTGGLNYWDAPVLIAKARYVHVDGFIYEMLNLENPSFVVWIYSSKVKITRTIVKRSLVDAWGGWYSVNGSDNLIEDAAGVGAVRYGFATGGPTSSDQRNIFRRVVGRMDYANTSQPKATFAVYGNDATTDVRDHLLQNTIAIDGQRPSANGVEEKYGGYYNPKTASYIRYQGAMTLNEAVGHAGMFAQEWGIGIDIKHSVVWDLPNSMSYTVGIRANTASSIAVDSVTIGGNISGGSLWSSSSGGAVSATNSALGGTHANLLNNTPGAVIMKRYGVSGTFWGEPGYDQLTNEDLWPWPYEDKIKAVFAEPNDPPAGYTPTTNNTRRGFAATGNGLYGGPITLTSYIWEYLGTPCPATVCTVP